MNNSVRGSVVITGASTGIGAACALHLDQLGFQVFAGVRTEHDVRALQAHASARLIPIMLDVTQEHSILAARDVVATRVASAGLSGLVNNAGFALAGPLELLSMTDLRKQLEVNVIGQVAVSQVFLPLLRQARGRIVNMSSIAGRAATPFLGAYSSSKFALESLSDALRCEVRPWGVSVSLVEPGAVQTEIWERSRTHAEATLSRTCPDQLALYKIQLEKLRELTVKVQRRGIPAIAVAKVVAQALTATRPKTRYLVGYDAKFRAFLKFWLSDRMQDAMLEWFLGLPRKL
jgi:NAD(P)-dependent dehydrogenase (short-subunit alcohol dehydrogenase family)